MSHIDVVIGSNYGDEGKGCVVNALCTQHINAGTLPDRILVVRSNGGAQAGHTVVLPDQTRHVFSHVGAGSLLGCHTYLAPDMIVNPIKFIEEMMQLSSDVKIPRTAVSVDYDCLVTTPVDLYINWAIEQSRGDDKHGSCGMGIFETVVRSKSPKYKITCWDLLPTRADKLKVKLRQIYEEYLPTRLSELGIAGEPPADPLISVAAIDVFMELCTRMFDWSTFCNSSLYLNYSKLIFEGAQGLMLDQNNIANFPHLTPSNTGASNPMDQLVLIDSKFPGQIDNVSVYYVMRAYNTRHGAGPLPYEDVGDITQDMAGIDDFTNLYNTSQGHIRYAPLCLSDTFSAIECDIEDHVLSWWNVDTNVVVTCVDQVEDYPFWYYDMSSSLVTESIYQMLDYVNQQVVHTVWYTDSHCATQLTPVY